MLVTFPWNQKKMFMLLSGGRGNNHICCVMKKTTMNWTKRMTISTKIIQTGLLKNIINNNQQTIIPYHYSCCSGCMHIQIRSLDKQIWLVVSYMSNSVTCQTGECWRVKKLCRKIPIPIYYCVYKKLFRPSEKHFLCPFQVKEPFSGTHQACGTKVFAKIPNDKMDALKEVTKQYLSSKVVSIE